MQTGLGPVTRVEKAGPERMHVEGEGEGPREASSRQWPIVVFRDTAACMPVVPKRSC